MHRHTDDLSGFQKTLGMLAAFENFAVIGALAFEDLCAVMQGMGEVVEFCLAPWEHFAIHPYETSTIVEGN